MPVCRTDSIENTDPKSRAVTVAPRFNIRGTDYFSFDSPKHEPFAHEIAIQSCVKRQTWMMVGTVRER